jgi:hypothetical protein
MGWKVRILIPGIIRILFLSKNSKLAERPTKALVPRTEEVSSPKDKGTSDYIELISPTSAKGSVSE